MKNIQKWNQLQNKERERKKRDWSIIEQVNYRSQVRGVIHGWEYQQKHYESFFYLKQNHMYYGTTIHTQACQENSICVQLCRIMWNNWGLVKLINAVVQYHTSVSGSSHVEPLPQKAEHR